MPPDLKDIVMTILSLINGPWQAILFVFVICWWITSALPRFIKRKKKRQVIQIAVWIIGMICMFAYCALLEPEENRGFKAEIITAIGPNDPRKVGFFVPVFASNNICLTPLSEVAFVRLTNTTKENYMIDSVWFDENGPEGLLERVLSVSSQDGVVYNPVGNDLFHVDKYSMNPTMQDQLYNRNIGPGEVTQGWIFFKYTPYGVRKVTMHIKTTEGMAYSQSVGLPDSHPLEDFSRMRIQDATLIKEGVDDISGYRIIDY